MIYKTGWLPDKPDKRDFYLTQKYPMVVRVTKLNQNVDLRPKCPPVYDQGELGSCVGNACGFVFQFEEMLAAKKLTNTPSRLFIYYNARKYIGTTGYDSGAEIRDGIKSLAKLGTCYEDLWAYNIKRFTRQPIKKCYLVGATNKALSYFRLNQTREEIFSCLLSGFPFVLGVAVYESFISENAATTGVIPMPQINEAFYGGHAIAVVGYDWSSDQLIFRNSWGEGWGNKGYGTIPMNYVLDGDLAADLWTIRKTN
jgi:C1A family cysteine protease